MFEKEGYEWTVKNISVGISMFNPSIEMYCGKAFKDGAEFGYNKAKEEVKNDLMMKLKDEGIVKPLKDSILQNERLSSQEQQELCAWIECAMDFGENLDECAKELEEVSKANEWQYPSKGEYPKEYKDIWICFLTEEDMKDCVRGWYEYDFENDKHVFKYINDLETQYLETVIAWKEIVLPELKESEGKVK